MKDLRQRLFHALKVRDARSGLFEPLRGDLSDRASVRSILQLKEIFNLLERKPQFLRTFNEADSRDMTIVVSSVRPDLAFGLRDQPAPFVVANGFHSHL